MSRLPVPSLLLVTLASSSSSSCLPTLALDGVTPDPVAPGATLSVDGRGFADGLRLTLVGADDDIGDVEVALQDLAIASATSASALVPAAAPAGTYELVADLDGAVARLPNVRVVASGARVHFLDIGQGDATLVVAPTGEALLVDGGPFDAGPVIADAIARLTPNARVDAVVLSHTDADHLAGLVDLLAGADGVAGTGDDDVPAVRYAYVDDGSCDSQLCDEARALAAWPFDVPAVGEAFQLGDDVDVEIVAADGDVGDGKIASTEDENERSVVVRVTFAGRSVLITGDLTGGGNGDADVEGPLAAKTGPVDVLRVAHHGSNTSSNAAALAAWAPKALVLSLGTDNAFCHPSDGALSRLVDNGAPMWATGAGVVEDGDRCGGVTPWPANARVGLGTITLEMNVDGSLVIDGETL